MPPASNSRPFRVVDDAWITLADGTRLAARMWIPEAAAREPVPAVLEYLPYRKRDGTALRDETTHPAFAARGYACVRVDIRGNGDSQGLMLDEYTPRELADGVEVIEWIAAQPWCSGRVGMIGISWGGFNGLQIAALAPPALRAVVTVCSTDDRYADDIHYMGGCLLNDNLTWSAQMLGYSSRPPDPALVGEAWRELWLARLENMPFLAANWLRHQRRDDFWRHGSVCEDYSRIGAAVLAVGGWADAYSNAVPRLLAGLRSPCKGVIGPWEHHYPNIAVIEPRMDFLGEALRWWDRWLGEEANGVEEDPALRVFVLDSEPPHTGYGERAGRWVGVDAWPPGGTAQAGGGRTLHLGEGVLAEAAAPDCPPVEVASPQHLGAAGGAFCAGMRIDEELPGDQRADDAASVCFDGEPLAEPLHLLGAPEVTVEVESDRPRALLAVRLCDLRPDGASARITWAPLNLTHRDGHADPLPLVPGRRYRVSIRLNDIAYRLPAGHRLRLALSTTYWPMLWPSPQPAVVTVHGAASSLWLPVADAGRLRELPPPPAPQGGPPPREILRATARSTRLGEQQVDGTVLTETTDDLGRTRDPGTGLVTASEVRQRFLVHPREPGSASAEARWVQEVERGDWRVRTESYTRMHADPQYFHLEAGLIAYEGGCVVFDRTWSERVPRAGV